MRVERQQAIGFGIIGSDGSGGDVMTNRRLARQDAIGRGHHIDAVAMRQKIAGTDEYLDHWHWGEPEQREGSAQEVADALKRELEEKFPLEF